MRHTFRGWGQRGFAHFNRKGLCSMVQRVPRASARRLVRGQVSLLALCRQRFNPLYWIQDLRDPQGIMTIHDNHLSLRDNFTTHEELHGFQDLLIQFHHSAGAELENVSQLHITFPKPQGDLQFNIKKQFDVSVTS